MTITVGGPRAKTTPTGWIIIRLLLVAVGACAALSLVSLLLYLNRTTDDSEYRLWYGFLDKRWLVALYYTWLLGLPMAILVAGRVLPYFPKTPFVKDSLETRTKSWFLPYTAALYLLTVVVVWLLWGPPYGDGILGGAVDIHESVAYKGIQAVITGTQQYVDAASFQYGPLIQDFRVWWILNEGPVSIAGLRESDLVRHFSALLFIVSMLFTFLRSRLAAMSSLVFLLAYPTASTFSLAAEGPVGLWGTGNLWRTSGILLLALAIASMSSGEIQWLGFLGASCVGAVWALTTLVAQENFFSGLLVVVTMTVVVVASHRSSIRNAARILFALALGAVIVWGFYLLPYLVAGTARQALFNYWIPVRTISDGYTNTKWQSSSYDFLFYSTPILLLISGVGLALYAVLGRHRQARATGRPAKLGAGDWLTPMTVLVATVTIFSGSLTRADWLHFVASSWTLPVLVVVLASWIWVVKPIRSSASRILSVGFVAVFLVVVQQATYWPLPAFEPRERLQFALDSRAISDPDSTSGSSARIDDAYLDLPKAVTLTGETPQQMKEFANFSKDFFGSRPVLLDPEMAYIFGNQLGYFYFIADLVPFALPYEELSVAFTRTLHTENLKSVLDLDRPLCGLMTTTPTSPFAEAALARMGVLDHVSYDFHAVEIHLYRCR